MTITELAKRYVDQFERREMSEQRGFVWFVKDECDDYEDLQALCQNAHGEMLPDDHRYGMIVQVLNTIADFRGDELDEARDDLQPLIYTGEQTRWLGSHADRMGYCNDALEEHNYKQMSDILAAGYMLELEEIFSLVLERLTNTVTE